MILFRGPSLLLYLAKENCQVDFSEFLGPFSCEEYRNMPGTYVYHWRNTMKHFLRFSLRYDFDEPTISVVKMNVRSIEIFIQMNSDNYSWFREYHRCTKRIGTIFSLSTNACHYQTWPSTQSERSKVVLENLF